MLFLKFSIVVVVGLLVSKNKVFLRKEKGKALRNDE